MLSAPHVQRTSEEEYIQLLYKIEEEIDEDETDGDRFQEAIKRLNARLLCYESILYVLILRAKGIFPRHSKD